MNSSITITNKGVIELRHGDETFRIDRNGNTEQSPPSPPLSAHHSPAQLEAAASSDRPMTDMEIKLQLSIYADRYKQVHKQASAVAVGRKARIVSDFNGQPHGRSRKPLTGKVVTISSVSLYSDGKVSFCSWDVPDAGFGADDVEFIS